MNKPQSQEKKDAKAEKCLPVAGQLFYSQGIEDVKMTDIASACGLGVATLYRAFRVKKTIVIAVGTRLWHVKVQQYYELEKENEEKHLNGLESYKALFNFYQKTFQEEGNFFLFLKEFDSFCLKEKVRMEELASYEAEVLKIHSLFIDIGQRGIKDGSIRGDIDFSVTYFAYSKAMVGLCQKLIGENNILKSDLQNESIKQLQAMSDIICDYLKAR
jgi:AcrR family transcriptional regulator